jgi:hypothetical protein
MGKFAIEIKRSGFNEVVVGEASGCLVNPRKSGGFFYCVGGCIECECVSEGKEVSDKVVGSFFALLILSEYFDTSNDLYKAH